jgi:mannose/fructose/N-acetylgalactosamine-specific phosphotransferase system component IIC
VKAVVKHGLEVAGWLLIALGLAVGLREHDRLSVTV